jgi:hypothetical protein
MFSVTLKINSHFLPKNRLSSPETTQVDENKQDRVGILVSLNPI